MSKKHIVLKEFSDIDNFTKKYKVGDELPADFSEERLENIVKLGLAKVEEEPQPPDNNGGNSGDNNPGSGKTITDIDLTGKAEDIIGQVKVFADVEKLKQYLKAEKSAKTPREAVVKAIEERLENIVK
jgi:hypothetical protein